ncbi:hypothetical protein PV327_007185 [Microctonus hyperodae]|uniref:C-type lectin domain-containing protein n=1 Tax=Microctonus hyperodae TaxID=165561 RepID=A0AA39KJ74_MICHY|nr:hypothetical protein PV327_007185 [Microctonus hyperodae]
MYEVRILPSRVIIEHSEINEDKSKENSQSDNGQFVVFDTTKSWRDAALYCQKNGMRIGEINTIEEAQLVSQMMLKTRPAAIESAWIGGIIHLISETDNSWRWLSSCEIIAEDNELWLKKPSEIKDEDSSQSESSHTRCLLLDRHLNVENQPFYIESACDRKRGFICQKLNPINTTNINTTIIEDLQCLLLFSHMSDSMRLSINMETTLSADMTPGNFISSTVIPPVATTSNYSPLRTATMVSIESPPTEMRKKEKIKTTNRFPITTITSVAVEPTEEEEYSDYKMWELGRKQMERKLSKKKTTNENKKSIIHETEKNDKNSEKINIKEIRKNFVTTHKPKVKQQSTTKYFMHLRPIKPLRLYYAFEGPMIGGLTATPLPQIQYAGEMNFAKVPCYHKYMNRREYNEIMSNKTPV